MSNRAVVIYRINYSITFLDLLHVLLLTEAECGTMQGDCYWAVCTGTWVKGYCNSNLTTHVPEWEYSGMYGEEELICQGRMV
jgi:hypothetical protein